MGMQWNNASAIYRLQESLWPRMEVLCNILNKFGIPVKNSKAHKNVWMKPTAECG